MPPLQVDNWSLTTSPREASAEGLHFLVSIGTVPGARSERWVEQTIHSLLQQTRKPDRILVVAPKLFVRFPNQTVNLASVLSKINGVGMVRVTPYDSLLRGGFWTGFKVIMCPANAPRARGWRAKAVGTRACRRR